MKVMRKIIIFTMIILLLMSSSAFANNFTSVRVDAGQLGQINRIETRAKSPLSLLVSLSLKYTHKSPAKRKPSAA